MITMVEMIMTMCGCLREKLTQWICDQNLGKDNELLMWSYV